MRRSWLLLPSLLLFALPAFCQARVPALYSTDLYHPHDDPDDHYDLATLFALQELRLEGIIIDMSNYEKGKKEPGVVALRQMFHLSGRTVPYALGFERFLNSADDKALEPIWVTQ